MDVADAENSTSSSFYTKRQSGELLRENYPLGYFGITLHFALLVLGFIANCILFEAIRKLENSSMVWMKHFICWNNFSLALDFLNATLNWLTPIRLAHSSRIACRATEFFSSFLFHTPLLMLSTLFVDQALFMTNPTWHFKQEWKKQIPKISAAITLYSFLYCSPMVVINDIRFNSCEVTFVPLSDFLFSFNIFLAGFSVCSSNIIFIVKLRQNRMEKDKQKKPSGEPHTDKKTQKQKFSFSEDDWKAVKVMLFFFIGIMLLLSVLTAVSFLVKSQAESQFQMDIFFWVVLGWILNFQKGLFILLYCLARDSSRNILLQRYFK